MVSREDPDLAATLAVVAQLLAVEKDVSEVLRTVCRLAVETIDGCEHADVMIVAPGGNLTVPAATDWVGMRAGSFEEDYGEGPCTEAYRTATAVDVPDHNTEVRWPRFIRSCLAETPVRSQVGLPLVVGDERVGALDLYADHPHAFQNDDRAVAALFAAHAAVAFAAAQQRANLEHALATRDVIGQAKGILMARSHITADEAFVLLGRASQRLNQKLNAVAQDIVNSNTPPRNPEDSRRSP